MCTKTPKVQQPKEKKPQYLRNPFLDGLAVGGGQSSGRNSLRIDPGTVTVAPISQPLPVASTTTAQTGGVRSGLNTPRYNNLIV